MKDALSVLIDNSGFTICHPQDLANREFVPLAEAEIGKRVHQFCARQGIDCRTVILFVSETLLFFKVFELPAKTVDLQEAIGYQIGLLTPFEPQNLLYAHTATRDRETYQITLYAVARKAVDACLEDLREAGLTIIGLFPEFLRYVAKGQHPSRWGLVLAAPLAKVFVFKGARLAERLLCAQSPSPVELAQTLALEAVYHTDPPPGSGFQGIAALPSGMLALRELNLLPASFRRPDYSRLLIAGLAGLNILALLVYLGMQGYRVHALTMDLTAGIEALKPQVSEVRQLRDKVDKLEKHVDDFNQVVGNPDIIRILKKLADGLPHTAYLTQISMDKGAETVIVRGYTSDMAELTAKLQSLGQAKLKSTSRRRDQTYFDVEIGLP